MHGYMFRKIHDERFNVFSFWKDYTLAQWMYLKVMK